MAAVYVTLRNGDVFQVVPRAGGGSAEVEQLMARRGELYSNGWIEVLPVSDIGSDRDRRFVPTSEVVHIRVAE